VRATLGDTSCDSCVGSSMCAAVAHHRCLSWCGICGACLTGLCLVLLLFARSASIIDALPDRPDPASWGGMQPVSAAALTVQGIK
jgi:hypothetical protein